LTLTRSGSLLNLIGKVVHNIVLVEEQLARDTPLDRRGDRAVRTALVLLWATILLAAARSWTG
jgi:hypothetical protein